MHKDAPIGLKVGFNVSMLLDCRTHGFQTLDRNEKYTILLDIVEVVMILLRK